LPSKYAYIDDTAVHYRHSGPSTLPRVVPRLDRGQPLLFVHDAGGNADVWQEQLRLCGERHSPVLFDFPGHGRSGGTQSPMTVEACARLLLAFVEALNLPAVALVGHGLGASIAIEAAASSPRRVRALVLVGASARAQVSGETLRTWENVMRGRATQPFTTEAFSAKTDFAIMRRAWTEQVKTDPRVRYFDLLAWSRYDARPRLASIVVPTVIVAGKDDAITSMDEAAELQKLIPDSKLVSIEDAGHMLPLEKPVELAAAITEELQHL
jgi:pimeloyl-ACP methyl ester carboxylesterase